jgi:hypothetical protein
MSDRFDTRYYNGVILSGCNPDDFVLKGHHLRCPGRLNVAKAELSDD